MSACTNKTVLLKDKHRGRTLVGSESGTTPRPAILCRGSSWGSAVGRKSCGWRLGEKDDVEGQEGKAKTRALWSYFREAPHGVMQTHGQPPRPSMFAHLRLAAARRGQGGPRSEEPKLPKVGSRVSPATVHSSTTAEWLRGTISTMDAAADGLLPRHGPPDNANKCWSMLSAGQYAWR